MLRGLAGTLRRGLRDRAASCRRRSSPPRTPRRARRRSPRSGRRAGRGAERSAAGGRSRGTPCIIGVAQRTWHLRGDEQAPEPLAMADRGGRGRRPPTPEPAATCWPRSTACRSCTARAGRTTTRPAGWPRRSASTPRHRSTRASAARSRSSSCRRGRRRSCDGGSTSAVVVGRRGARHGAPAEEGGRACRVVAPRSREEAVPVRGAVPPGRGRARGVPGVARRSRSATSPVGPTSASTPDEYRARHRRADGADDRDRGGQPQRVVPGQALGRRAGHADAGRTAWSATRTRSTWCRSWTSTWPPRSSSPATRRPTGSACRPSAACTCGAGRTRTDPVYVAEHPDLGRSPAMRAVCRRRVAARRRRHRRRRPPRPLLVLRRRRCTSRCDALGHRLPATDRGR